MRDVVSDAPPGNMCPLFLPSASPSALPDDAETHQRPTAGRSGPTRRSADTRCEPPPPQKEDAKRLEQPRRMPPQNKEYGRRQGERKHSKRATTPHMPCRCVMVRLQNVRQTTDPCRRCSRPHIALREMYVRAIPATSAPSHIRYT